MKVLLLSAGNSIHTQRWVEALHERRHRVILATQHSLGTWLPPSGVEVHKLPFERNAGYFLNASSLWHLVRTLRPDILNAHYASGYGLTSCLASYEPTLLSVWGSDIFDFPDQAWWKAAVLRRSLRRATRIASTSRIMAAQVRRLVPEVAPPIVTPFGVDCTRFRPDPTRRDPDYLTIGTVKTLEPSYGIDVLIDAFSRLLTAEHLREDGLAGRMRLVLVGGGAERTALESMVRKLGISDKVVFVGPVAHGDVPNWLNQLDIYVAASRSESFGVAVVEASACGLPVVVSDAGGLPEVVRDGVTGLVVPRENPEALAEGIKRLLIDSDLRHQMGNAGREFVLAAYDWERCVDGMEAAYAEVIAGHAG